MKSTSWPTIDIADVGLGDLGVDLHVREVVRDLEDDRRAEAGGDGLAHIDQREMTMPSIGEEIWQWFKSRLRLGQYALLDFHMASAWCRVAIAWSRTDCGEFCFLTSSSFVAR